MWAKVDIVLAAEQEGWPSMDPRRNVVQAHTMAVMPAFPVGTEPW